MIVHDWILFREYGLIITGPSSAVAVDDFETGKDIESDDSELSGL